MDSKVKDADEEEKELSRDQALELKASQAKVYG